MRIQETDRILKESRISRHNSQMHQTQQHASRSWMSMMTSLPQRLMSMFHK